MPRKPRRYESTVRDEQASATRARIVEAGRKLFAAHGFDGTTIQAIATEARVSVPTVYAVFASKRGIVAELLDKARFGASYDTVVAQAMQTPDPVARLRLAAKIARGIFDAERTELRVLSGASAVSSELATREHQREGRRYESQRETIEILGRKRLLKRGLDVTAARDVLWTLTGRDVYRMMVLERDWTPDRYETWLGDLIVDALVKETKRR